MLAGEDGASCSAPLSEPAVPNTDPSRASAASRRATSWRSAQVVAADLGEERRAILRRQAGRPVEHVAQVGGIDHQVSFAGGYGQLTCNA